MAAQSTVLRNSKSRPAPCHVALALGDEPYPVLSQHEADVLGAEADVLGHLAQEQEAAECETGFRIVDVRLTTLLPKGRTANDKVAAACHDEN
ncbi:hypothetical protein PG995_016067 [Apiospora arundinis]